MATIGGNREQLPAWPGAGPRPPPDTHSHDLPGSRGRWSQSAPPAHPSLYKGKLRPGEKLVRGHTAGPRQSRGEGQGPPPTGPPLWNHTDLLRMLANRRAEGAIGLGVRTARLPGTSLRITLALAEARQGDLRAPPQAGVWGLDCRCAGSHSPSDTLLTRRHWPGDNTLPLPSGLASQRWL